MPADNGRDLAGRDTLCWPYGLPVRGSMVAISDSGNSRVLPWPLA